VLRYRAKAIVAGVGKVTGSWLEGPGAIGASGAPGAYAGQRIGLPPSGRGAVAGYGRRLGAIVVDWFCCQFIAGAITGHQLFSKHPPSPWWALLIFGLENVLLISSVGTTLGMRLFGIGVRRLNGRRLQLGWVVVRTMLLLIVIPAVVFDRDQRGLHDRAAGAVAVRL